MPFLYNGRFSLYFLISQLTELEITSLYERLSSLHGRRLMAFYQVRSLFAQGPDSLENFGLESWLEKQIEIPF